MNIWKNRKMFLFHDLFNLFNFESNGNYFHNINFCVVKKIFIKKKKEIQKKSKKS